VIEHKNSPCHVYSTWIGTIQSSQGIRDHFRHAFETFLRVRCLCGRGRAISVRKSQLPTMEFSNASCSTKTSIHVKVGIVAESVVHTSKFTKLFNDWLLLDTPKFLYKSLIDVNGTSTILDTNVHSNFQNFRMLHMTKAHDDETYLQPDEYSSDACIDHLIGFT
jgi:hypothetical protein